MTTRIIVAVSALACMSVCGILATLTNFEIIDQVNKKLRDGEQFDYAWWYMIKTLKLRRKYRTFYPDGGLVVRVNILTAVMFVCLLVVAWGLGAGQHLNAHAPFPEIHDWNSLRITLNRSACYGRCPTYEIEIHGDRTVLYDGKANVATKGRHTGTISHAALVELVDAFRKADYFSLSERYVSGVTDNPTYVSSISFDRVSKSVLDYVGRSVGMPSTVSDVEAAIDRLSGAYKWIGRER